MAIDDMVVEWREFTLEQDTSDCTAGQCATLVANLGIAAYDPNQGIAVSVLEATPDAENDCDLDGTPDGTNDCDGNGTPDLVVRATSQAEVEGERIYLNQCDGTAGRGEGCPAGTAIPEEYRGSIVISQAYDAQGILFVAPNGNDDPLVTLTYLDNDDGTGVPCPDDVDPAKHGLIQHTVTVLPAFEIATCNVAVTGTLIDDNDPGLASPCVDGTDNAGDGDNFADTNESVCMGVRLVNHCAVLYPSTGFDLHNCTARISSNSPQVECILRSQIDIPLIPYEQGGVGIQPADWFVWKASALDQSDPMLRADLHDGDGERGGEPRRDEPAVGDAGGTGTGDRVRRVDVDGRRLPERRAAVPLPAGRRAGARLVGGPDAGDLSVVGSLLVTSLEAGADADFEDGTALSPGAGYYYLAGRLDASLCNESPASWDGCDAASPACGQSAPAGGGSRDGKGNLPALP